MRRCHAFQEPLETCVSVQVTTDETERLMADFLARALSMKPWFPAPCDPLLVGASVSVQREGQAAGACEV